MYRRVPPAAAAARAARGRALCQAALDGALPDPDAIPAVDEPDEVTACRQCFSPHVGQPGTLCARCLAPPPRG